MSDTQEPSTTEILASYFELANAIHELQTKVLHGHNIFPPLDQSEINLIRRTIAYHKTLLLPLLDELDRRYFDYGFNVQRWRDQPFWN